MNPILAEKFYFIDNDSRNFVDCVDGVCPAACRVFEPSAFCRAVHEYEK